MVVVMLSQSETHVLLFFPFPCSRRALVSSKTKLSKKVFILHLEREALLSNSGSEQNWKVMELRSASSLLSI